MNNKKLDMAYKRYKKNFIEGYPMQEMEAKYEEAKKKIKDIIKNNELKKDHIFLTRLARIRLYYLTLWKHINFLDNKMDKQSLKKIQIIVFFQCFSQELYKERYPNMLLEYNLKFVVIALIHFNFWGWEKEEGILLEFIKNNISSNILNTNDDNKHVWFLLELYLKFKNETILGVNENLNLKVKENLINNDMKANMIPNNLEIYEKVFKNLKAENIDGLINEMIIYHSEMLKNLGEYGEFRDYVYGFYPIEILYLIHIRKKLGLSVPEKFDDFLMNTPEAKMEFKEKEPYPEMDELVEEIDKFYRRNYPEYIPNKHGELFK